MIKKVIDLLKMAGIDASKYIGKVDPGKVKQLIPKNQKTATKPKLIDALTKDKATFSDALNVFENDAKYLSQMNEMELVNFANNLDDYFKVGGKVKYRPSNVVTPEGTPIVGKKLEKLAARKGAADEADTASLEGSMKGLMTLVDELKGISPKMRNKMDRDDLAKFLQKMRGKDFTNDEIKLVREYMDEWGIGLAKEKAAPAMAHAKKLGAKNKEEFQFIEEYLDNVQTTSPEKFREMFDVKKINMDINSNIENKLEKHFKKKFKWDDTKKDGGLDDATFTKYEDELYEAQTEFMDFHRVYDNTTEPNIFGIRKSTGWANNPKNYLDDASEKLQSITGEGLNTNFWKNYTDEVLGKYPKPEKFQYGGIAGMLGEPAYQDEDHRVPYGTGKRVTMGVPSDVTSSGLLDINFDELEFEEWFEILKSLGVSEHASGGRVSLKGGKSVVQGLAKLFDEFFPGTTKLGKRSKPFPEKVQEKMDLRKAIAGFHKRENIAKELENFRGQIDDNIIKEISAMDPAQQLKAIEEVKFFIKSRKNLKQELTLRDFDVTGKEGHATGGRVPLSGGGLSNLLKIIFSKAPKKSYKRIDLEKLLKGKDKIKLYSGSMDRSSNTWQSFIEDAKILGTTPEKIAKDKFKDQWFTPFKSYAEMFGDPKYLHSKMRTVELTPKEIAIAKRYVEKVNKKDIISMRKKLGIKPYPKHNITTDENLVLIPKYKLKELEKAKRIKTDYLIKEKIKEKLGLAKGGVAGMLGE